MKDNKLYILMIILIISIVFHGIIIKPNEVIESKYEIHELENKVCVLKKDEGKLYCKSVPENVYFNDWTLILDINELK